MENKNLLTLILVTVLVIVLCMGGCHLYNKGYTEAKNEVANAKVDARLKVDFDSLAFMARYKKHVEDSVKPVYVKYDSLLKLHGRYQVNANAQRVAYASMIDKLKDSIRQYMVDTAQVKHSAEMLDAFHNYPIALAQLDTCGKDKVMLEGKVKGKELELKICNDESKEKDVLATDVDAKHKLKVGELEGKFKKKNFWIFAGWGVAIAETVGAVYVGIKSIVLK